MNSRSLSQTELDQFFSQVDRTHPSQCHVWRGSKSNKGHALVNLKAGGQVTAARHLYEHLHGRISPRTVVIMRCGNRLCVNPEHMSTGSYADAYRNSMAHGGYRFSKKHGSNNPASKLTEAKVREIRSIYGKGGTSMNKLSKSYGVSHRTIDQIVHRRAWAHVE